MAITAITIKIPTDTPASKISPTSSHPVNKGNIMAIKPSFIILFSIIISVLG